ncbi:enoyl-CoA hydratase/isomerase family protein [Actinoplanes sp. NPDC049265]|uniref:enoyl-CoA hydratase/isomerase family protein n=1 Tax=Actinoplanes sp. NPDC049265 TaxID=3363902 RepID=UPI00371B94BD
MDRTITTHVSGGVLTVTLHNPPVNVLSATMMRELHDRLAAVRDDPSIRVIVFDSADSEFFLAHVDIRILDEKQTFDELVAAAPAGLNVFQAVGELIRHQPQVTIVKLAGIARGGGAEFVAAADLTFAALETARIGQIESLMGIIPGGGGTQYLRERIGRNRAMEVILTGDSVDAATAAAYGWINRALPADELDEYVTRTARDIAALPDGVIPAVKRALPPADHSGALLVEDEVGMALLNPVALRIMSDAIEAGAQTPDGERRLEALVRKVWQDNPQRGHGG